MTEQDLIKEIAKIPDSMIRLNAELAGIGYVNDRIRFANESIARGIWALVIMLLGLTAAMVLEE